MRLLTEVEIEIASGGVMVDDGLTCREATWWEAIIISMGNMGGGGMSHGSI